VQWTLVCSAGYFSGFSFGLLLVSSRSRPKSPSSHSTLGLPRPTSALPFLSTACPIRGCTPYFVGRRRWRPRVLRQPTSPAIQSVVGRIAPQAGTVLQRASGRAGSVLFIAAPAAAAADRSRHRWRGHRKRHRKNRAVVCDAVHGLRERRAPVLGLPAGAAVQVTVGGVGPQTRASLQRAARAAVRYARAQLHRQIPIKSEATQTVRPSATGPSQRRGGQRRHAAWNSRPRRAAHR
jgi:hypothetical protein